MTDEKELDGSLGYGPRQVCRVCQRTLGVRTVFLPGGVETGYCPEHWPYKPATQEELSEILQGLAGQQERRDHRPSEEELEIVRESAREERKVCTVCGRQAVANVGLGTGREDSRCVEHISKPGEK